MKVFDLKVTEGLHFLNETEKNLCKTISVKNTLSWQTIVQRGLDLHIFSIKNQEIEKLLNFTEIGVNSSGTTTTTSSWSSSSFFTSWADREGV